MMLASRIVAAGMSVVSLLFLSAIPAAAQQAAPATATAKPETAAAKPTSTSPRRVPNYFGQLGLSPEQRESIYQVVDKHKTRIEELKKELAEANSKMVAECETLLNDAQKQSLEARRSAAADASKARAVSKAAKAKAEKKPD